MNVNNKTKYTSTEDSGCNVCLKHIHLDKYEFWRDFLPSQKEVCTFHHHGTS